MSQSKRYDDHLLRRLRNEIPTGWLMQQLGWPCKHRDGRFVFLCPVCNETDSAVNPKTNLGRCFRCERNFNPIDFVIRVRELDFPDAVELLIPYLSH